MLVFRVEHRAMFDQHADDAAAAHNRDPFNRESGCADLASSSLIRSSVPNARGTDGFAVHERLHGRGVVPLDGLDQPVVARGRGCQHGG